MGLQVPGLAAAGWPVLTCRMAAGPPAAWPRMHDPVRLHAPRRSTAQRPRSAPAQRSRSRPWPQPRAWPGDRRPSVALDELRRGPSSPMRAMAAGRSPHARRRCVNERCEAL